MKTCKVKNCNNEPIVRGFCQRHYAQIIRNGKILKRTPSDPNEIVLNEYTAEITLYNKNNIKIAIATIDIEDVDKIKNYKWSLSRKNGKPVKVSTSQFCKKRISIQHIILGITPSREAMIDHIDTNPLNNKKNNLRMCNNTENCRNTGVGKNNMWGYKGVKKRGNRWGSRIMVDRKELWLGTFGNKEDAAMAYNVAAIEHFGKFANLNLIQ